MNKTKRNSLQYTVVTMILTQFLLLLLLLFKSSESANTIALPECPESCGNIPIPYPFGIGSNCSLSGKFDVTCKTNDGTSTPYLGGLAILNISLELGQARISSPISYQCYNSKSHKMDYFFKYNSSSQKMDYSSILNYFRSTPFSINNEKNKFTVTGCHAIAYLDLFDFSNSSSVGGGCLSSCDNLEILNKYGSCSGIGCCQTTIPRGASFFRVSFDERYVNPRVYDFSPCSYAMVVEESQFMFDTSYITTKRLADATQPQPMVVDWVIGSTTCNITQNNESYYACRSYASHCFNSTSGRGYYCKCPDGFEGNPYLDGGCLDIDECANIINPCSKPGKCYNLLGDYGCYCPFGWRNNPNHAKECQLNVELVIGMTITVGFGTGLSILLLYFVIAKRIKLFEKRKQEKIKRKFFDQNRGLLLQQLIASQEDATQNMRILRLHELEKATNRFDKALIIGRGGHGEVYKGILSDQRVVAIKKSKIVDPDEIDQFINEVVILSQVNHRNIVKLYGCCLETEVPLLAYEFISNGTLFNHLHVEEHCSLTWKHRLRIALEAAGAISYLHSSASISVFHRDIKSANILLDDYFTAKVSDFGASRSVQIDQTGIDTIIQGTPVYLDPEYHVTGRLTQKSDVYSFGVILAELLTRENTLSRKFKGGNLVTYFKSAMKDNRLFEILDPQVVNEGHITELKAVANLAEICLRMRGDERPTMKDVEVRLEVLWQANRQQEPPSTSRSLEERQLMQLNYTAGIDTTFQCSFELEQQSSTKFLSVNELFSK